jgi:rhodanese-related sulfurtransferase
MRSILFISIFNTALFSNSLLETGCSSFIDKKLQGCALENILNDNDKEESLLKKHGLKKSVFRIREETDISIKDEINITVSLKSIKVTHQNQELLIVRNIVNEQKSCPPFCIEPMNIDGVKTVAELETLSFIENLKENKNSLLLDTREHRFYKESTIPGSINLPYSMIQEDSQYFKKVLALLGIRKVNEKWQLKDVPKLLVFDNGVTENKASRLIKSLLKLSYPSDKILYYRAGIVSWKSLGLTLY